MSPARRSHRRRDWPRGLYEPRPGYYVWRHPTTHETMPIGRVALALAKSEALAANAHVEQRAPSLVERMTGAAKTVGDLLDKMPAAKMPNTAKAWRSMDKLIRAAIGNKACGALRVADCAEVLEPLLEEGKHRMAQAVRSRLVSVCKKGMALGWMEVNPAEVTEQPEVEVQRGRLTFEAFQAIYARAPEVNEWLQRAMMLALVSAQDRSTVADMERSHAADGYLTVWRRKTRSKNRPVDIPLALRMDCVGVSLADLVAQRTGVVSRYLLHHVAPYGNAPTGSSVSLGSITKAFTAARKLAGIDDAAAPTFHEIRSLSKRLYDKQGGVDTKALLGHTTERMSDLYADLRGVEHIRVKVA